MSDLIERINNLGKIKKAERDNAECAFIQSLKDKISTINNLRSEAKELVDVCKALADNKFNYYGEQDRFSSDNAKFRLGFTRTRFSDAFHLAVLGDADTGNKKIVFLCHGHDVEWGSSLIAGGIETAGLLIDVLDSPTYKGHDLDWVRKFEPLLDVFINNFDEFGGSYMAYAENLIKEA